MNTILPVIDAHAHIDSKIDADQLVALRAIILAATRSLDEFFEVANRKDSLTIWGVGAHPGVPRAIRTFEVNRFREALELTPIVSEIGLDGTSVVPMALQMSVLDKSLEVLQDQPRVISIHSARATSEVLEALGRRPVSGAVLHWWRGTPKETKRAIDLGCWFSVNQAEQINPMVLGRVPAASLLTETDHPYGDKKIANGRPGLVEDIEKTISIQMAINPDDVRKMVWANFARLIDHTEVRSLIPPRIQALLEVTQTNQN